MDKVSTPRKFLGLRHVALYARNLEACVHFYTQILGMTVIWQPDADNIYLSSGTDNLALHRAQPGFSPNQEHQHLDHLGFFLKEKADVDIWHEHLKAHEVLISAVPKDHRDGARSFYCLDPDGNSVQLIWMPGIAA